MERYELSTIIDGKVVCVRCGDYTARVLLPMWAADEPNATACRDLSTGVTIAAFGEAAGVQ